MSGLSTRQALTLWAVVLLGLPWAVAQQPPLAPSPKAAKPRVGVVVETTLGTASGHIRQFAFDPDPSTYFESAAAPAATDHFDLRFDQPVTVKTITVQTGTADGKLKLDGGKLAVSADGTTFESAARFAAGSARADLAERKVIAVRIQPSKDMKHALVVRDIVIDSEPRLIAFRHPVEMVVDVTDAPQMKPWAEKAARVCERQYPMICDELASPGFTPLTVIHLRMKADYDGVAAASGGEITGSVKFFTKHPDDIGAMVHETTHCVQLYHGRGNPGWLVEGVADYIRFFKYEPGTLKKLTPEHAKFDGSYRTTAAFLDFVTHKYDAKAVKKLNAAMRAGKYSEAIWKEITGKTVEELGREWKASLAE